jgi:hypothetical protein
MQFAIRWLTWIDHGSIIGAGRSAQALSDTPLARTTYSGRIPVSITGATYIAMTRSASRRLGGVFRRGFEWLD